MLSDTGSVFLRRRPPSAGFIQAGLEDKAVTAFDAAGADRQVRLEFGDDLGGAASVISTSFSGISDGNSCEAD